MLEKTQSYWPVLDFAVEHLIPKCVLDKGTQ